MALEISSQFFTWEPKTQTFAGEASELEGEMTRQGHTRLAYEKGKWGFYMISARTGRRLWFERKGELRTNDVDNELVAVQFAANLNGKTIYLNVFND